MRVPGGPRIWRCVLLVMVVTVALLRFLYYRGAVLPGGDCSSIDCFTGGRLVPSMFKGGGDNISERLTNELVEAAREAAKDEDQVARMVGDDEERTVPDTFDDLVAEAASKKLDIRSFISKTKSLIMEMDRKLQRTRKQELEYRGIASMGLPYNLRCLSLKLAEEYSTNNHARALLIPPEYYFHRFLNRSYHHVAIISDNVIAARVVVVSAIKASSQPEKMVFHVLTDKFTHAAMHAWFALNPVWPAMLEVRGLHQFYLSESVVTRIMETMEIHRAIQQHWYKRRGIIPVKIWMDALRLSHISLLNHIRIYLPELFPELGKVLFLDDDVVVQKDLSPLWSLPLNGKVNAAVSHWSDEDELEQNCVGGLVGDHLNFSNPAMSSSPVDKYQCSWLYGVNIFDLDAWRSTNITQAYHHWLKLNQEMGFSLWRIGALPPALLAFADHVHPIDPSWHVARLGEEFVETDEKMLESAAVLHFSGPAKPWLSISSPELSSLWSIHFNHTNEILKRCEKLME